MGLAPRLTAVEGRLVNVSWLPCDERVNLTPKPLEKQRVKKSLSFRFTQTKTRNVDTDINLLWGRRD